MTTTSLNDIVKFIRVKDYKLIREMGQGACGKTVLLYDETIDTNFVCKKYHPFSDAYKEELFPKFVEEIKILHLLSHRNLVRIFNHYIYPEKYLGYILMEYIDGDNIEVYIKLNPSNFDVIFEQIIEGFSYLEENNILHRDVRPDNILVNRDGVVKIIDFGFGKKIQNQKDFDKSITLNWWCSTPPEFSSLIYDFQTEMYFVGNLLKKSQQEIPDISRKYKPVIDKMSCANKIDR